MITKFNNFDKLKKKIRDIEGQKVFYGYFNEQGQHPEWDISFVDLMTIHEYGTDKIPARPVFTITLFKTKATNAYRIKWEFKKYFKNLDAKHTAGSLLSSIGQEMAIATGNNFGNTSILAPNSAWTIREKGFNSPLIWTGELKANIAYRTTIGKNIELAYQ